MNKKFIGIISVVVLIALFGIYFSFKHNNSDQNQDDEATVTRGDITQQVIAVGNIMPEEYADVKSPIAGTVAKVFHDSGDYVTKGQALLEVKPQPTPDDYAMAKQQVETDKVGFDTAEANLKRYKFLLQKQAINKDDEDFANARDAYNKAVLALQLDRQRLSLLEKGKAIIGGHAIANIIHSPVNGYILEKYLDPGAPVIALSSAQAGSTLFTIANMNHLVFKGQVSEIDSAKIHTKMAAIVEIAALPNIKLKGELTQIALQSVQANNTQSDSTTTSPFNVGYQVQITKLEIPKNLRLLAGYSATANITIKSVKNILTIPERLLHYDDNNNVYVWIPGVKHKHKPKKQIITVGLSDGMQVQVLSGLKFGDTVLANDGNNHEDS